MSEFIDENVKMARVLRALDDAWPFKRISAPKHLIDKYNETVGKDRGAQMVEFAITVNKDYPATDEDIWNAMNLKIDVKPTVFGDSNRVSNPPHTGMAKKSLWDI